MEEQKSLKKYICELLKTSGKPLSIEEIILQLERTYLLKKTKQQIQNALSPYDCKEILRVGKGTYELLSRILNGIFYRYPISKIEIINGMLSCDYELNFIFDPYSKKCKRELKFFQRDELINSSCIKFLGPLVIPRRQIHGFTEWFKRENLAPEDDIIIKILDLEEGLYELIPQKKALRDKSLIQKKNKEVADLVVEILNRISTKSCWPQELIKRVIAEYSYKDSCPPDHLSRIIKKDKRFTLYEIPIPIMKHSGILEIRLKKRLILNKKMYLKKFLQRGNYELKM